jgi:hypothetical protein
MRFTRTAVLSFGFAVAISASGQTTKLLIHRQEVESEDEQANS